MTASDIPSLENDIPAVDLVVILALKENTLGEDPCHGA